VCGGVRGGVLVVAAHVPKLGYVVPTVLKLMMTLLPLLSIDAAFRTLMAEKALLLRLLVDLPLRALQRCANDVAGLGCESVLMAARLVAGICLAIGPEAVKRHVLGPIANWLLAVSLAYTLYASLQLTLYMGTTDSTYGCN